MAGKWYKLAAYGSSRKRLGDRVLAKFTDLKDVVVVQVPYQTGKLQRALLMKQLGEAFGPARCVVVDGDIKLFFLEEVSEEEVIAEELMKP